MGSWGTKAAYRPLNIKRAATVELWRAYQPPPAGSIWAGPADRRMRVWTGSLAQGDGFVNRPLRARSRAHKAHANVVVAVVGRVVVAIRRPHILGIIVEVATPDDAIGAGCGSHPKKTVGASAAFAPVGHGPTNSARNAPTRARQYVPDDTLVRGRARCA